MNIDNRYCAVVNSHASYHDVLVVFLKTFQRHSAEIPLYIFTNRALAPTESDRFQILTYSSENFRDQYMECLLNVPYDYILTFNDDYFLTAPPNYSEISRCVDVLEATEHAQIRFVRGPNFIQEQCEPKLYGLDNKLPFFFSQTLSLWKREELMRIFERVGPAGIARKGNEVQFEVLANSACEKLGLTGLVYYSDERKVGSAHYESNIFPHIVSAVVDRYWNTREYAHELRQVEADYKLYLNPLRHRKSLLKKIGEIFE